MGVGASVGLREAITAASDDELKAAFADMDEDLTNKLRGALETAGSAAPLATEAGPVEALSMDDVHFTKAWRDGLPTMEGKVVAITGCTSGTGYVAAMECAKLGARVLLLNRASSRAEAALKAVGAARAVPDWRACKKLPDPTQEALVEHIDCDLMSLESVKSAAEQVLKITAPLGGLDVLILNAGITDAEGDTVDGYDKVIQVNFLAHMLLLAKTFSAVDAAATSRGDARVVFHSSIGHAAAKDKILPAAAYQLAANRVWPDEESLPLDWKNKGRYYLSKTQVFVSSWALHEKLQAKGSKVRSLCAHPGFAATNIFLNNEKHEFVRTANEYLPMMGQSDGDGATPLLTCALLPDAASGDFYGSDGSKPLSLEEGTQMKGPPEKVTLTDWQVALTSQGATVWKEAYEGLGIEFDV